MEKITFSESFARFCKDNSDKSALCRCIANYIQQPELPAWRLMFTTGEANYITFRDDGTISYLPAGKEHKVTESGTWAREGRQNAKPGKVIRKILTAKANTLFKDSDFETFANLYKKTYCTNGYEIKIESDIERIYNECANDIGSCMEGNGNYYSMLEGVCKVAALYNHEGYIIGRALLWPYSGTWFMDRIYTTHDHLKQLFIDFCEANKFYRKKNYSSRDGKTIWIDPAGQEVIVETKVECDQDGYDPYAYLDTFQYGDEKYLYNYSNDKVVYEYDGTDGNRTECDVFICSNCGEAVRNEDDICGDYCSDCAAYDEYADEYILHSDAVELVNGRFTHREDATYVQNYGYIHDRERRSGDYMEINGDWYHTDDVSYCDYNEDYYPCNDVVYVDDLDMNVHVDSIEDAYEANGWVMVDGKWVKEEEVEDED